MKNSIKHVIGYVALKRQFSSEEMLIALYAGLLTYRNVTAGPSVNPMDYMFSTKHLTSLTTAYGYPLYMKLHLPKLAPTFAWLSKCMISSTFGLYQGTMQDCIDKKTDSLEVIMELHCAINKLVEAMPKQIEVKVNRLAFQQTKASSLGKRTESIMTSETLA